MSRIPRVRRDSICDVMKSCPGNARLPLILADARITRQTSGYLAGGEDDDGAIRTAQTQRPDRRDRLGQAGLDLSGEGDADRLSERDQPEGPRFADGGVGGAVVPALEGIEDGGEDGFTLDRVAEQVAQ